MAALTPPRIGDCEFFPCFRAVPCLYFLYTTREDMPKWKEKVW